MTDFNPSWDEASNKIWQFEEQVLKPVLPHARFADSGLFGSPDQAPNVFDANLSPRDLFKDTVYEYNGNGLFIHFTSLAALNSILEKGWVRMSEFGNLADTNELVYAATVFNNDPVLNSQATTIEELKDNVFCLSCCESNEQTQKDSLLWESYADRGKGVFFEFKLTNPNPYFHQIGIVQYGLEALSPLHKLKELYHKFRDANNNFSPKEFLKLIVEIQAFHKAKRFSSEKEVRILFRKDKHKYEEHKHYSIYKDINSNQEVKYFSKLYLKGSNTHPILTEDNIKQHGEENILELYPQLEITRIVLGYNISVEKKIDITQYLHKIKIAKNYEYEIWQIDNEEYLRKMY